MAINRQVRTRKVLVTGANGFIGRALCGRLLEHGYEVYAVVRKLSEPIEGITYLVADLESPDDLSIEGLGIDCVIHLAGRAHVLGERNGSAVERYRAANCDATVCMARLAIAAGVERFIFVSSIGVNGAETGENAFDERSSVTPHADYAVSKYEAELKIDSIFKESSVSLVIVRPPLVYDAAAPGNFARLLRLVSTGLPLPFACINNKRSMVSLRNLIAFLEVCISHPGLVKETFVISDGEDVSTPKLIELLREGMGSRARLFPVPRRWALLVAKCIGRKSLYTQLFCSLRVDSSKAQKVLGWQPEENTHDALVRVGRRWLDGGATDGKMLMVNKSGPKKA